MTSTSGQPPAQEEPTTNTELPTPADPWAGAPWHGSAAVPTPRGADYSSEIQPHVIYVEQPRRRRWPWIVGGLVVLLIICGVLGLGVTAPMREQHPAKISIASNVAGLRVLEGAEIDKATAELERQIRTQHGVNESVARMFEDPSNREQPVYFFGATLFILDPPGDLTKAMRDLTNASNIKSYDAGPFGGYLRCGPTTTDDDKPAVACAWIDHGSIAVGVFPGGRSMDDSAAKLRQIRGEVLSRS